MYKYLFLIVVIVILCVIADPAMASDPPPPPSAPSQSPLAGSGLLFLLAGILGWYRFKSWAN